MMAGMPAPPSSPSPSPTGSPEPAAVRRTVTPTRAVAWRDGRAIERPERLSTEEPMEIRASGPGQEPVSVAVTMRTPGHDFELAAGFLFAEGLIAGQPDLRTVAYCTDRTLAREQEFNVVTVELDRPPRRPPVERYDGPGAGSSACGVCGKQSIDDVLQQDERPPRAEPQPTVPAKVVTSLPDRLREEQRVFDSTGGLHAAGLFTEDGTPLVVREDVGRHNAVDKVVGARLLAAEPPAVPVMCVSGRIGFELVQKAVAAGVGMIAAVGAPSSLAVRLAEDAGLCAVGFVSADRFVVYSCPERISG